MDLQDRLLASNRSFLLGSWLSRVPPWASSAAQLARLDFDSLEESLRTGAAPTPTDWFALGDAWSHGARHYSDRPTGDSYALAAQVARVMRRGGCP